MCVSVYLLVSEDALDEGEHDRWRDGEGAAPVLGDQYQPVDDGAKTKGALVELDLDRGGLCNVC